MAQFETWLNSDLQKPLQVQYLKGNIFSADNEGNKVGVRVFSDGEPVTLAGTVSGNVIRADGTTVAVEGVSSGNEAYIVLPQAAYAVPGVASIIIKITNSGAVTTLGACVVTIYESTTSTVVDPGTIIPSIEALIADIDAAVASIPADYSSLWTSLAPTFSTSDAYSRGQYVTYDGKLYRFLVDHSAGSWVSSHAIAIPVGSDLHEMNARATALAYNRGNRTFAMNEFLTASNGVYITGTNVGQVINILENADHRIVFIEGEWITRISFTLNQSAGGLPIITVVNRATGVVLDQYAGNQTTLKGVRYYPNGLGAETRVLINWFGANSNPTAWLNGIEIEWKEADARIEPGRNKFDKSSVYIGDGIYTNNTVIERADAKCIGFTVPGGGILRLAGMGIHATFFKEYHTFISGVIAQPGDNITIPSDATYMVASFTAPIDSSVVENCIITVNDSNLEYAPFTHKFINEQESASAEGRFEPYAPGQIHFTIPVNQTILKNGQNTASAVDSESIVNVNAVLRLPGAYSSGGKAVPLIIICHGSGFGVNATNWGYTDGQGGIADSIPFNTMINAFISAGYAVCDVNGYDNTVPCGTWGATRAVYAYRKLYEYVIRMYNVQHTANVFGFSMGGIVALNFMFNNRDIVKALELSAPVTHLYSQVYSGHAHWKEQMAIAFGFDGVSGVTFTEGAPTPEEQALWDANVELTIGFDPAEYAKTIGSTSMVLSAFPPIRAWHGTSDDAVSYTFTQSLIEKLRNGNNNAQIRLVTNAGHEICYGDNSICNTEYVLWFDRFNSK